MDDFLHSFLLKTRLLLGFCVRWKPNEMSTGEQQAAYLAIIDLVNIFAIHLGFGSNHSGRYWLLRDVV
jgi:hypothetical protein